MPTWFLTPCGVSSDKQIALGNIITDPLDAEECINGYPIAIPSENIDLQLQMNFDHVGRGKTAQGVGLWIKFLECVGVDVSGSRNSNKERTLKCDKLETRSFKPDDDYVAKSIAAEQVQQHIARQWRAKPLYMITSVKIAYGATVTESMSKGRKGNASASADVTALAGVPVGVGSSIDGSKEEETVNSYVQQTPLVWAYRLRQIRYKKTALSSHQPYRDGATYGVGSGRGAEEASGDEKKEEIVFEELDEDNVTADEMGIESIVVDVRSNDEDEDDGDESDCEVILPREKSLNK
ncbi:hypothetical protein N3K66_005266 [Trichothecium roseum]|uniref:Uncharacterized protein n=1 Tax=Trichothecium roseum TaxID=47278 RepID=A0ACC0V3N2_9HYPO|nr:hypothetical protein N3K66_005266 [Trichothecium roseum]